MPVFHRRRRVILARRGATSAGFTPDSLPNLAGWYRFDEGAGTRVKNCAASGNPSAPYANIICAPESLRPDTSGTATPWQDMFGGGAVTNAAAANPVDGATTASRLTFTATGNKAWRYVPGGTLLTNGQTYTVGCWVKSNTGLSQNFRFFSQGPTYSTDKPATTSWAWQEHTFTAGASSQYVGIANDSSANAADLLVYGVTLVPGSPGLQYAGSFRDFVFPGGTASPTWSALGLVTDGVSQYAFQELGALALSGAAASFVVKRASRPVTVNQWWYGGILNDATASLGTQPLGLATGGLPANGNRGGISGSYNSVSATTDINLSAQDGVADGTFHAIGFTHDGSTFTVMVDGHVLAQKASVKGAVTAYRNFLGYVQGGLYAKMTACHGLVYSSGLTEANLRQVQTYQLAQCSGRVGWVAPPTSFITCTEGDSIIFGAQSTTSYSFRRGLDEFCLAPYGEQARTFAVSGSHVGPYPANPSDTNHWVNRQASVAAMKRAGVTAFLIAMGAANDASDTPIATTQSNLQAYGSYMLGQGVQLGLTTMCPKLNDGGTADAFRAAYDSFVKTAGYVGTYWSVAPCDLSLCDAVGPNATAANTFWYYTDKIHPLDSYYFIIGPIIAQWYQAWRGRPVTAIFTDTFTEANGTLTTQSHWPDYAAGGWVPVTGTLSISSNQLTCGTAPALAVAGAGRANYTLSAGLQAGTSNARAVVRWTHPDNYYYACVNAGAIEIHRVTAGVDSGALATSAATAGSLPLTLQVVTNGSTITASVGATSVSYNSATQNQNSTVFGLSAASTAAVFDNVSVTA
jgi:hypothetical protein